LISQAVISIILVLLRNLDQLTSLVIFTSIFFNFLIVVAVMILRRKYPTIERPFKIWGYPFSVIISALLFLGLVINTLIEDPVSAVIGLIVPAVGAVVYLIFDRIRKNEAAARA
jgi:APA family basic amino acid/polyamine antiporter